ncbi:hypothetical protein BDR26DRAFT_22593 [Obelidium mucronatum]|nr:hypothetical protein BDR26DRAFT_22593 [Obelidium mucronatum]
MNDGGPMYMSSKRPRLMPGGGGGGGGGGGPAGDRYSQQTHPQAPPNNSSSGGGGGYMGSGGGGPPGRRSMFGAAANYDEYKRRDSSHHQMRDGYGDYRGSNYSSSSYMSGSSSGFGRAPLPPPSLQGQGGGGGMMMKSGMASHGSSSSHNTGYGRSGSGSMMNSSHSDSVRSDSRAYHPPTLSAPSGSRHNQVNSGSKGSSAPTHPESSAESGKRIGKNQGNSLEEEEGLITGGTPQEYDETLQPADGEIHINDNTAGEDDEEEGEEEEEEGEIDEGEEGAIDDQQLQMEDDEAEAAAAAEEEEQEIEAAALAAAAADTKAKTVVRKKPFAAGKSVDIAAVCARVLAENQERAKANSRKMFAELKEAVVPVQIRRNVEDYPSYHEIRAAHIKFRPLLAEYIADRKYEMEQKKAELRQEYSDHYLTYKKKMERLEKKKKSMQGPALAYAGFAGSVGNGISGALGALSGDYGGTTRSSRRGTNSSAFTSDAVKSEAEWEQVLAAIAATEQAEVDDSKLIAQTVADPPMILDPLERQIFNFQNFNRLVLDPVAELAEVNTQLEMKWTEKEREMLRYKLVQYGKDFPKIAMYLGNKTTQDCIQYYYREKFSGSFKQLLRKAANSRANMRRRTNVSTKKPSVAKSESRASLTSRNTEPRSPQDPDERADANNDPKDKSATTTFPETVDQHESLPPVSAAPTATATTTTTTSAPPPTNPKPKSKSRQSHPLQFEETSKFTISDVLDGGTTRWTVDEKARAFEAFGKHGRDFEAVATAVGSKTTANVEEFFNLYKRKYKLDQVVSAVEAGKMVGGGAGGASGGGSEKKKKSGGGGGDRSGDRSGGGGKKGKHVVERGESSGSMDVDDAPQIQDAVKMEVQNGQSKENGHHQHPNSAVSWTNRERDDFVKALQMYGCNWDEVAKTVTSKAESQIREYYHLHHAEFDGILLEAGFKPETDIQSERTASDHYQPAVTAVPPPGIAYATDPNSGTFGVFYAVPPQHAQTIVYGHPAFVQPPAFHPMHGYNDVMPTQYMHAHEYPGASYAVGPYLDIRGPQFSAGYPMYHHHGPPPPQPVYYQGAPPPYTHQQQQHDIQQQQHQQHHHQHHEQHQPSQAPQENLSSAPQPPPPTLPPQDSEQQQRQQATVLPSIRNLISD